MKSAPPGTPRWETEATEEKAPPAPVLRGSVTADVAVVGAGLAGLSTAYHLAERAPGTDIAVVDADRPAAGASGRGTGLLGPRAGPPADRAVQLYGAPAARRMHLASQRAVDRVLELCAHLDVACSLRTGEQLMVTRSAAGLAALARQARAHRLLGLDIPVLTTRAVRERVGVPYTAGLLYAGAATLDPAALTRALARACAAKGVRFYGGTPLRALRNGPRDHPQLGFPQGRLRARHVVLAVNAGAQPLGLPVGTVLPMEVYAVATAPLTRTVHRALGGRAGSAVVDAVPLAPSFRLLPDGGLVAGGGTALPPAGLGERRVQAVRKQAWAWLERWLATLHPELARVRVTHRWSGRIGMTGDGLPVVGPVRGHPGVWYVGGCNGHGLAMSVAHGRHVAGALLGEQEDGGPLPWHRSRAPRIPLPPPLLPLLRRYADAHGRLVRRTC